ncbi:hypothetical protein [Streptomyces sp. NPDC051554]|uniref:hypothetical protein n=1 Tax=Streptomyces sp. NPDC051554 TaxID=3365656 RepID=UPI00379FE83C
MSAATLRPLLGERQSVSGPVDSVEVRLLVAHSDMIYETAANLGPAEVQAAHSTLIDLAKAVARRRVDDAEPQLALALAQAAKDLADNHLTDPELSGTMLARELNVFLRSLQLGFAARPDADRLRPLDHCGAELTCTARLPSALLGHLPPEAYEAG